jgi:RNase adaptor protein for sRNA GlmZ degradation
VREGTLLEKFPRVFETLRSMPGLKPTLIFLEASEAALVRRYSETRRPHPLARHRSALEGVREERARLAPIRRLADEIVDTSDMNVHELREAFMARSLGTARSGALAVTFLSFGFKYGLPLDADLVFDVRFLPNPHFVARLRERTGRERPIVQFLDRFEDTGIFLAKVTDLLQFLIPRYAREGKSYLTCRHRLHRRAPSLGRDGRSAGQGAARPDRRAPAGETPGRRQCLIRVRRSTGPRIRPPWSTCRAGRSSVSSSSRTASSRPSSSTPPR